MPGRALFCSSRRPVSDLDALEKSASHPPTIALVAGEYLSLLSDGSMARSPDGPMISLSPPTRARLTDKPPPAAHNKLGDTSIYRRPKRAPIAFRSAGQRSATVLFENWRHFPTRFAYLRVPSW